MEKIYLDYNASTPIAPEVSEAMKPYFDAHFGNPSSAHWAGAPAKAAVETARSQVSDLLGCQPRKVVFTSGGSEANNHALKGVWFAAGGESGHIITTQVEHPAILSPCAFLERLGALVTYLPVDSFGVVDPDDVRRAITPKTVLITAMHANNEVGTIQPIADISTIAREHGVVFHTDAAQSVGKISTNVDELGVDLLSVAGHKVYAPKGVGAIYIRSDTQIESFVHGAGHESGRRAGTENVLLNVGLGKASEAAQEWIGMEAVNKLRDRFWDGLKMKFGDDVSLNGHPTERLPNTLNVNFVGRNGAEILAKLEGVAASTGSACHADRIDLSPVLQAMGTPPEVGMGAIRFSLGRSTTDDEIESVLNRLPDVVR
ncbi:MAG: cysteine desulfurase family protein [Candidatus Latescibacteria bacterium]|nr:cysteine desulfurase family protein [Candidatus Latescibacterota bacterium]